jgi:anti-sigma-K factor RskA
MSMADPPPEDEDLRAAELAFGLLDEAERLEAESRAASHSGFAASYQRWQARAAALLAGPDVAPRPSVWTAIEARLPANDVASPIRSSVRWWQAATLVASAAAGVLAVVAVEQRGPVPLPPLVQPQPSPPLVAVLTGKTGVVTVSYDRSSGRLTSAPTGVDIGDHSAELWVIPADGKPRSLGVIAAATPGWTKAPTPFAPLVAPGVTLAISVEPVGGSPTGQPTGPVILTGKIAAT